MNVLCGYTDKLCCSFVINRRYIYLALNNGFNYLYGQEGKKPFDGVV
jgi:hypothetical protein